MHASVCVYVCVHVCEWVWVWYAWMCMRDRKHCIKPQVWVPGSVGMKQEAATMKLASM